MLVRKAACLVQKEVVFVRKLVFWVRKCVLVCLERCYFGVICLVQENVSLVQKTDGEEDEEEGGGMSAF